MNLRKVLNKSQKRQSTSGPQLAAQVVQLLAQRIRKGLFELRRKTGLFLVQLARKWKEKNYYTETSKTMYP